MKQEARAAGIKDWALTDARQELATSERSGFGRGGGWQWTLKAPKRASRTKMPTSYPHVHVLLAGAGEREETGELEPVKLYVKDYQYLRERGHEHSDHDLYAHIRETVQELDRQDDLVPSHAQTQSQEVVFDH